MGRALPPSLSRLTMQHSILQPSVVIRPAGLKKTSKLATSLTFCIAMSLAETNFFVPPMVSVTGDFGLSVGVGRGRHDEMAG